MGCALRWACRTCKARADLGYGSYASVARRETRAPVGHDGHETLTWVNDAEWGLADGTLWDMGAYGVRGTPILERVAEYTHVEPGDWPDAEA